MKCKECGYQWQTTPSLLLKGSGCVSCYGLKRKTTDEFVSEMKTISPHIEILGDYINTKTKIKVKSNICGHIWESTPNSLLKGRGCPQCAGNKRKSTDQFKNEMIIINPNLTIEGEYVNAVTKLRVKCKICGLEFLMTPNSLLNGHGCKVCNLYLGNKNKKGKTHRKNTYEFVEELAKKNPTVEVIGEYTYSKNPINVKCKICGYEWSPQAGSLLAKHGCPICAKTKRIKPG